MARTIAIGSDHGGVELKARIIKALKKARYAVDDVGTDNADSADYPAYGYAVAKQVSSRKAWRGIVICKSGIGMSMVANKVSGVRAGLCLSVADAVSSRQHNDANVLVLAATRTPSKTALEIIKAWLKTKALGGRHARRVKQIKDLERKEFKKRLKKKR